MKRQKIFYSLIGLLAMATLLSSSIYAEGEKADGLILLIVQGDDMACSHAANVGCIKSYKEGVMRSVEVMVPCPWFEDAAKMLNDNPGLDVGIHLTLTSEWDNYKWRPLTCGKSIANKDGYFYQQTREWDKWPAGTGFYDASPKIEEVEAELRAQIEMALKKIKNVSHISNHMYVAQSRPELLELVKKLAKEYKLNLELELEFDQPDIRHVTIGGLDVKRFFIGSGSTGDKGREAALVEALEKLGPGTWFFLEHPGADTPEMQAMGHSGYGYVAKDRDDVTRTFTSEKVKEVIKRRGIKLISCGDLSTPKDTAKKDTAAKTRRFFSDTSFWNTPIPENPEIDPKSDYWIGLLKTEPTGHRFVINCEGWTVPVYQADVNTPRHTVKERGPLEAKAIDPDSPRYGRVSRFGHGPEFKDVPIPDGAVPDPCNDAHIAMVDWDRMIAWDMFAAKKLPDGSWCSYTGMVYRLDGDGIFKPDDFPIKDGESIHFYGPGRAAGVPIIAGLIIYDEVLAGEIPHRIAAATRFNALKEFVFPATWTDGNLEGGIPEGAVIQLDPKLDLDKFDMLPGEKVVAKALQRYGMVIVDAAGGSALYAEGLYGHSNKSWNGTLRKVGGIDSIPLDSYRIIKLDKIIYKGDHKRPSAIQAPPKTSSAQ